ncbi:hypothetical protein [Providencia huashanensis]
MNKSGRQSLVDILMYLLVFIVFIFLISLIVSFMGGDGVELFKILSISVTMTILGGVIIGLPELLKKEIVNLVMYEKGNKYSQMDIDNVTLEHNNYFYHLKNANESLKIRQDDYNDCVEYFKYVNENKKRFEKFKS